MAATNATCMCRLNCPESAVFTMLNLIWLMHSVSSPISRWDMWHRNLFVGKSGDWGPISTRSMMNFLARKATTIMTSNAMTPRTRWGRRASICSKKVISSDDFFIFSDMDRLNFRFPYYCAAPSLSEVVFFWFSSSAV